MFELPVIEIVIFVAVILLYLGAAVLGSLQLRPGGDRYKPALTHLFALAVVLEAVMLIFRAISIGRVPLTGLFESMIVLTLVLGLIYLVLGMVIRQVWFSTTVAWIILILILLTAIIAQPAAEPLPIAAKPWAIVHGMAMILGAAMILLATVSAYVYLLGCRRLKQKKISQVLGKVPNIQKLDSVNLLSLKFAFVFITIGLASGIGGVWMERESLGGSVPGWLIDSKIIAVGITWLLLGLVLLAYRLRIIKGRRKAQTTILAFFLILFAFVGAVLLCNTKHDFSSANLRMQVQSSETNTSSELEPSRELNP